MKPLLIALLPLLLVPFFFWLGGYNFDERGATAFFCGLFTVIITVGTYAITKILAE